MQCKDVIEYKQTTACSMSDFHFILSQRLITHTSHLLSEVHAVEITAMLC